MPSGSLRRAVHLAPAGGCAAGPKQPQQAAKGASHCAGRATTPLLLFTACTPAPLINKRSYTPVDDGRVVRMQVHQPLQDLPCPALEHLFINGLVLLAVPAGKPATSSRWRQWLRPAARMRERRQAGRHSKLLLLWPAEHMLTSAATAAAAQRVHTNFICAAKRRRLWRSAATHWRSVPEVNSSVIKLTVRFFMSSQES